LTSSEGMSVVRLGVLSTALINHKLLRGADRVTGVDVTAVASRDLVRARVFADEWAIPNSFGSYDELLNSDDVDAVYIPLPNGLHHEWTMRALRAGKHVLCEKPYSRRANEVEEAFGEAARRGLVLSEAFMFRYNPQIQELARLVSAGEIGELRVVNASFTWPTDGPGDIRLDPALDGGSLLDVGVYPVSAARLLAGEPLAATAQMVLGPSGVDTSVVATMLFDGGVVAHFDCGFHLPDRSTLEILGTTGTATVRDPWHCFNPGIQLRWGDSRAEDRAVPRADSYALELEQFCRAIAGLENDLLGLPDALGQALALQQIFDAASHEG